MDGIDTIFSREDMTFQEAVDYFKERVPVTAEIFYQIAEEYRALAFTVSGYTKAQILKKFYDELLSALEEGSTVMELRPFWQYDAVNDSHTRPSHLEMDGRVFPADSPVWNTWFPPNGFKCRCTVKTLSKRQVEQRGLTVETSFPAVAPDPHFGTNPAKVRFEPDLKDYPEPLVKAYQARQKEGAPK